ncbi:transglycosylase domain-containing protein [Clostridium perfringens]|uniref:transglycosylase domain-containing protein n=1 Tax=Clostridium perfringens TaxID=1502 RepID=UPI000D9B8136|nr:transglycosylase domain-containing protein [Clostridium perfringens]EJT5924684.1 transglycosylase domain-containing protein [Clostridium perfringens]MBP2861869.1 transglycosylase domain-containing protein [Clostridium perfringens]MDH5060128.1 Penicillin-binding protein 1A/1B [Clostridium perfringens NCTC 8239]MDM0456412.1 transglycosylase domain-containing protein [Clostridium perfringens]UBK57621.1 transglycosylase domain-containing protein [Clostridium perfringens]
MTERKREYKDRKQKKNSPKNQSKVTKFLKWFFIGVLLLGITAITIVGFYVLSIIRSSPELDVQAIQSLNQPSILYDDQGNFMDNVITREQRYVVKSDEIPDNLKKAFVAIEDERFYEHKGIDIKRIAGVIASNIKGKLSGSNTVQGASTITQQLIKNAVLTNEVSYERKIKEMYLALELEKHLSKDEILTTYLNTIPMGGYQYGVSAAAQRFFSKNVSDLNLIECAYLGGLTQAPTSYDGLSEINKENPSRYLNRTKSVLFKMHQLGYISSEQYNNAINEIDTNGIKFKPNNKLSKTNFEWFTRPTITQVKQDLMNKYKYTQDEVDKLIANGGLKIYTSMDRNLQNNVQKVLDDPNNYKAITNNPNEKNEDDVYKLQASATIIDYKTGHVKALVGGRGEQPAMSHNRAYYDLKSIGSATKPLTVYGPAIDLGLGGAGSVVNDSPLTNKELSSTGYKDQPKNEYNSYRGPLTFREAIKISSNLAAIKVANEVGVSNSIAYGEKLGLVYGPHSRGISTTALGQFQNDPNNPDGGNTYTLASAFGVFGNNGVKTNAKLYTKVLDSHGNVLLDTSTPEEIKIFSPQTSYIVYDMLKDQVESGSAKPAKFGNIPVAGKTGTTTGDKDYLFAGLTPYYSAAIWIGYDKPREMRTSSGIVTSPIFGKIMGLAHKGLQYKEVEQPSGISKIAVCMDSGLKPTSLCTQDPRGSRVYYDWFINGSAPNQYCNYHTNSHVNNFNKNNNTTGVNEKNKKQETKTEEIKPNENNKSNEQTPNTNPDNAPNNVPNNDNNNSNNIGGNMIPPQNQTENNTNNGVITPNQSINNKN